MAENYAQARQERVKPVLPTRTIGRFALAEQHFPAAWITGSPAGRHHCDWTAARRRGYDRPVR